MFRYKIDVLEALKKAGYSTYRLRHDKLLAEVNISRIRSGVVVGINALDTICRLLHRQPGSLIEWIPDKDGDS